MPYTVGLQSAAKVFATAGFSTQFTVSIVALLIILHLFSWTHRDKESTPVSLPGYSLFAVYPFFCRRHDFLNQGFRATKQSVFQFQLLRNTVVVVRGEEARKTFFSAKGLDITEGFMILSGAIPMVPGVTSDLQTKRISLIHKRLASVQRNAPLSELIPVLLEDSRRIMETWGSSGVFNPFDKVFELIFQTTVRSLSCSEISDDTALVTRLKILYDKLDSETTPATVLIPWFPTPAMIKKLWATKEIYDIVVRAIHARQQSGISRNDALQMLIDSGDEELVIVGFIMGLLVAGGRATGTTASWLVTYLAGYPEWRDKATSEVTTLLAAYPPPRISEKPGSYSLSAHFATIPLEAWEAETPVLDSIIRETLRVTQPHTAMRRNLGPDMYINDKVVPTGAYVVYPFSDVHLDPELYPDPWKFDPGRKEVTKVGFGYIGWGGGNSACLGTRLAKVELKLVTSMMLLGFRHTVVDEFGKFVDPLPRPNWNDLLRSQPLKGSCYIKYERSDISL